jgi:hypothetical protein
MGNGGFELRPIMYTNMDYKYRHLFLGGKYY